MYNSLLRSTEGLYVDCREDSEGGGSAFAPPNTARPLTVETDPRVAGLRISQRGILMLVRQQLEAGGYGQPLGLSLTGHKV
jgi:hypothetical protein